VALFEVEKVTGAPAATKLLQDMLQQRRYINAVTAPGAHVIPAFGRADKRSLRELLTGK
jgi:hypothetical protein